MSQHKGDNVYRTNATGQVVSKHDRAETQRLRDESRKGIERMRETTRKTEEVFKRVTKK
jgi:hypothetical protein